MKRTYRALVALLVAVVMVSLTAVAALAKSDYTYTVRIFGGNNGTINGQAVYTYSDTLTEGELVTLNKGWVTVEDGSKYYVKGFRESGKDELHSESFNVTSDVDLVVAYGVEGDMVTARINFVEYETGNALTADNGQTYMTFTGKVGDRFMLPFEYVTGYRPRYLNVTGVLGESGNEWNLEYIPLAEGETITTVTTTTETAAAAAAAPAAAAPAAAGTEAAAAPEGATAATPATPVPPATEEILDVGTPTGGPGTNGPNGPNNNGSPIKPNNTPIAYLKNNPLLMVLLVLFLLLLLFLLFILKRRRDEENENKKEQDQQKQDEASQDEKRQL